NIEQQLPTKKKKRFAFWWRIVAVAIVTGGLYLAVFDKKPSVQTKNEVAQSTIYQPTNTISKSEKIETNTNNASKENAKIIIESKKAEVSKKIITDKLVTTNPIVNQLIEKSKRNAILRNFEKTNSVVEALSISSLKQRKTSKIDYINKNKRSIEAQTIKHPLQEPVWTIKEKSLEQKPLELTLVGGIKCLAGLPNKPWNLSLSFGSGVQYVTNNTFFSESVQESNFLINNTGGGFGAGVLIPPSSSLTSNRYTILPLPQVGVHFNLGITASKAISKRFSLQTGLLYKYATNNSLVNVDSVATTINYYVVGNSLKYTNKTHSIQIPIQLQTNVVTTPKVNLYIITGVGVNWMLFNNYLTQSTTENKYLQNADNYTKLIWNAQAGLGFDLKNKFSTQIILNKGLTPFTKNGVKNYFTSIDAMFSIPVQ
ncbi:MAG: porin family protein, partial [Chitinophagaceae bacterium]